VPCRRVARCGALSDDARGPGYHFFVDLGAVFRFERPSERKRTAYLVNEFMSQVGVMAAFLYLREAVGALASRTGVEIPVLGLLRRGEVQLQLGAGDGSRRLSEDPRDRERVTV